MELAAQQLLRALRGKRSQRAFARRLGYRGNPMTDWENGRRYPTAQETLRAASLVRVDVPGALHRFAPDSTLSRRRGEYALDDWLRQLCGKTSVGELAARSGLSRFSIGRWLRGTRKPRLPDFLHLVDVATGRVTDLVAELVPIEQVPVLVERHRAAQAARRIAFDEPWSEAILRVLETGSQSGRYRRGSISERLEMSEQREAHALELLRAAKLVRWDGVRYVDIRPMTVDTRGGRAPLRALKRHWITVAAERAEAPRAGDVFAYNVLSVSAADLERIRALLHRTFNDIRAIVAASEPADQVALLNLQLVGWNGEPVLRD